MLQKRPILYNKCNGMELNLKKNTKIYVLVLVVIFLLAIIFVVFKFNLIQNIYQPKPPASIPQYFWPKDTGFKDYEVDDPASFLLRKGEEYQEGKSYEVDKPYMETVREIISIMNGNGWAPITGSQQDEKRTILKINNGEATLFIAVKKVTDEKSMVIFIPVERTANK